MQKYIQVKVTDFLRQMEGYIDGKIGVDDYCQGIFALMKRRMTISDEECRILQTAFHDADDYDAEIRLEHTILEPELRRRVATSIEELRALGHQ
jgi:hypothetical protein